jgi:tetratricopeptide (TPR) repeat protein
MNGKWIRHPTGSLTVIFVHGILSDGEACWRHPNNTYWPNLLEEEKTLSSIGIYVFEYDTGFFSGTYSLSDVVDALRTRLRLDEAQRSAQLLFVCHSMGGLVVRRLLVQRQTDFIEANKEIGLFLIASPSLGAQYAQWLFPLAAFLEHTQADALRFAQTNIWLTDLDRDFLSLKESGRLRLRGKELIEDKFLVLRKLIRRQVVEPFSGARYFPDPFKVPNSDHSTIAKPSGKNAIQHELLVEFIGTFPGALTPDLGTPTTAANIFSLRFSSPLKPDLVACQIDDSEAARLLNEGISLGKRGRYEEAIAIYDELVARFGAATEPALREHVAGALLNKGFSAGALNRNEWAIAVYDELVVGFGTDTEPALREHVAEALLSKGGSLSSLGRHKEAIVAYDELVARFGTAAEPALREHVAGAFVNKGSSFRVLGRHEEAIAVYDELVARFGTATELALREHVGCALLNKGSSLEKLDRHEEAIVAYDELVARFGTATELVLRRQVAWATSDGDRLRNS